MEKIKKPVFIIPFIIISFFGKLCAQNTTNQFFHELQFTRPLADKWVLEIDFGLTFTSTPTNKSPFVKFNQNSHRLLMHYYASNRWKLTFCTSYYNNAKIEAIEQIRNQELRIAPQGIYYLLKEKMKLSTRMLFEIRFIENLYHHFEDFYRYRQQIKYLKPFRNESTNDAQWYFFTSEELIFYFQNKPNTFITFDRNRFNIGLGKTFTDDFQLEIAYINEYLPRSEQTEIYHQIALSFTFNNLYRKLKNKIKHPRLDVKSDE
jgi:hypothetical protein